MKLAVVNGANLNMLGIREKSIYGNESLADLVDEIKIYADKKGIEVLDFQSNHEGKIIDFLHSLHGKYDGIIINPAAFTHYSVAIRDAILAINIPFIEVHLSNIYKREEFRHKSLFSDIALGTIAGFGKKSYFLALDAIYSFLEKEGVR